MVNGWLFSTKLTNNLQMGLQKVKLDAEAKHCYEKYNE